MEMKVKSPFPVVCDAIDPSKISFKPLPDGSKIPAIGLGTFASDRYDGKTVAEAVKGAIAVGYRHIDCASIYGNEKAIGAALGVVLASGAVKREDLWITSKLWNDMHGDGDVLVSCAQTLRDLGLGYLDLYLVHWPFPNHHPKGCTVESRSPAARPYVHEKYMRVWRQMERLVEMGLVKHIGTSNVTIPKLKLILRDAKVRPACNEMELHPHFQQQALFDFVKESGIVPIGYCPVGSPKRPQRDRTPDDTCDTEDPVIVAAATRLGVHPAVVCLKWAIQRGQIPIPFSVTRANYLANLKAAISEPLTDAEMAAISKIDKGCRLVKGQVFLWKGAKGWEDLWDLDGEIPAWEGSR
jgi:alcohol dehydrogenase (NADP+)